MLSFFIYTVARHLCYRYVHTAKILVVGIMGGGWGKGGGGLVSLRLIISWTERDICTEYYVWAGSHVHQYLRLIIT